MRSRCQTFVFARPRLPELVRRLRRVCDAEGIEAPDAALALIARGARGSFRDAESTLDQLASATSNAIDVQSVLQLLGAVEEEALFRLCDAIVDSDTAGALSFVEELAEQGQDLGRLVTELLEHLRHLLLVQHMGHVPDSLPVTDETRERLREQANQLPEPTVLRLCDLLAVAVDDLRQGGDPRLPLELALVKVTRPGGDLSRESLAFRLEQLEQRLSGTPAQAAAPVSAERATPVAPAAGDGGCGAAGGEAHAEAPPLALEQLQDAWQRTVIPAVQSRSIPVASLLGEARPSSLDGETLTLEFPATSDFHRRQADEPKAIGAIRDALYEVTGRRLAVALTLGEPARRRGGRGRVARLRGDVCLDVQGHVRRPGSGGESVSKMDMNKLMQQAAQMQEQVQRAQEEAANEVVEASAGRRHGHRQGDGRRRDRRDHDRPQGDRPRRPGDARRPRPRRRQRGAALGERADGVEGLGNASGRPRRAGPPGFLRLDARATRRRRDPQGARRGCAARSSRADGSARA